jgi:hypothetical protein
VIALVFVVAVLLSTVFAAPAGADPSPPSSGHGGGQLGAGHGKCTDGSAASRGLGNKFKICPIV